MTKDARMNALHRDDLGLLYRRAWASVARRKAHAAPGSDRAVPGVRRKQSAVPDPGPVVPGEGAVE